MKHLFLLMPIAFFAISAAVLGEDAPTTAPDKDAYTLFHPTPADQMRDMGTDRPNKTNTPDTVDAGHFQLESGILDLPFYRSRSPHRDLFAFGEELLRVGVLNRLELNAAITTYTEQPANFPTGSFDHTSRRKGVGDLTLGGTYNLWGNDAGDDVWATSLAISPQFKFPTASTSVGNGHFEYSIGVPFVLNLPAGFHLSAETILSAERNSNNDGYTTGWQNMICIDHLIFPRVDAYVEYWTHVTYEHSQKSPQTLDVGATYAITDSISLDLGMNFGLNNASTDYELVTGVSARF